MRGLKDWVGVWLRGVCMGAADVVPGVSGGTIAFISGIYEELLDSIRRINPKAIGILLKQGPLAAWQHINGTFLLVLVLGIGTSFLSLSRLIVYLLHNQPVMIWSFFFGLILGSALWMLAQVRQWGTSQLFSLLCGLVAAYLLTVIAPAEAVVTPVTVLLAGSVAICAMILPGISGSFILLLMGMYAPVLGAIKNFEWVLLGSFALGCVIGLLTFSHLLSWMFRRAHDLTVALLTGFMLGSLNKVWPWKYTLSYRINSHGEQVPLMQDNILPTSYQSLTGAEPLLWQALLLAIIGGALVYSLERFLNSKG